MEGRRGDGGWRGGNQTLCKQHDNKVASEYDVGRNVSEEHQRRGRPEREATNTRGFHEMPALKHTHTHKDAHALNHVERERTQTQTHTL